MKPSISLIVILATLSTSAITVNATAKTSGNVGVTSNYLWRGTTQSSDDAAVSGGIDTELANFSFGIWASSLAGSAATAEVDTYAAYNGKLPGFGGYKIGLTNYYYPSDGLDDHFTELNTGLDWGPVSLAMDYTLASKDDTGSEFSKGDLHYSLGASKDTRSGLSLGGTLGKYDFEDAAGDDYSYAQLSLGKGDFTFAVDKTSGRIGVNAPRVSLSWAHAIDF